MSTPEPKIGKEASRRIRREIRRVLLTVWDPIGVREEPYAQDEYDGYVGEVYALLVGGGGAAGLREYLDWVTRERMGMGDGPEAVMGRTVEALLGIPLGPSDG